MNSTRLGGLSAVLFGVALVAGLALVAPPFASMPADALDAANVEGRLRFIASLPQGQRAQLAWGFSLGLLATVFLVPAFLALHAVLTDERRAYVTFATALGLLGAPLLVLAHVPRSSLLELGTRYAAADAAGRAGLAAAYAYAENLGVVLESVFLVYVGAAAIAYGTAMLRTAFPRWLSGLSLASGGLGLVGALAAAISRAAGALEFAALLLFVVWCIGFGAALATAKRLLAASA